MRTLCLLLPFLLLSSACGSDDDSGGGGTSSGGAAGSSSGGGGSSGSSGASTGGAGGVIGGTEWVCTEAVDSCTCAKTGTSAAPCTGSYTCCFTLTDADESCNCTNRPEPQCTDTINTQGGTKVSACPP